MLFSIFFIVDTFKATYGSFVMLVLCCLCTYTMSWLKSRWCKIPPKKYTVNGKRPILNPDHVTGFDVRYQLLEIQNKYVCVYCIFWISPCWKTNRMYWKHLKGMYHKITGMFINSHSLFNIQTWRACLIRLRRVFLNGQVWTAMSFFAVVLYVCVHCQSIKISKYLQ